MDELSRREFLAWMGKGLLAAGMMPWHGALSEFAWKLKAQAFPLVSVAEGRDPDSEAEILKTALAGIGGIERFVKPGMTVAIKPNATWAYPPHTVSSSDPTLLRALIGLVRAAGAARIIVLDHCSIDPGTAEALRVSGIGKAVKEEQVEGIFPDRTNAPLSTYTSIELPTGKAFQKIGVIKAAAEADVRINLALAKTHNVAKVSMCLKHMMGFLQAPGRLHTSLEQGIADLSTPSPIQAQLHIMEALRVRLPLGNYRVCAGPETELTNPKVVKRLNQIMAGTDPVLMDSYGCINYFGMAPDELLYLTKAFEAGDGTMDVEAASKDGRLVVFMVGQPMAVATATQPPEQAKATVASIAAAEPSQAPTSQATATPLPTDIPIEGGNVPVGIAVDAGASTCSSEVVDARPFLNVAMIPVAGIVAGAGIVAAARRSRKGTDHGKAGEGDQDGKED